MRFTVEINDIVIYFVSRPLHPPSDVLQTTLPFLDLSSFLAAIFSTSLAEAVKSAPSTTFLIPHNSAFKRIGTLVREHLLGLGPSSKADLENLILHHVINGVQYAEPLRNGSQHTFPTLEGSDVQFDRLSNGSVSIRGSGGWPGMTSELYPKDHLTRTGVVHELSDLLLPRSMNLTIGKLMKAAKVSTMASLMTRAGMDWILNGTAPPEGSPWAEEGLSTHGWTLLCPTDSAFKDVNLTQLYADIDGVRDIARQHLIPPPTPENPAFLDALGFPNDKPLPFDGETIFTTLLTALSSYGDIVFRDVGEGGVPSYVVGIKGARGTDGKADWARVMAWGRTTSGNGAGGVVEISRLLVPYRAPWWIAYGAPAFVGVGGILAIGAFFYGVRVIWQKDATEATYEPVGGFGRDDDD
jgi:solute carrier family 25 carnitine/acylcarnitine transporter 20/29